MRAAAASAIDDKLPDAELARRVAAQDHEAFRVLMRRYNQRLYRTARSVLKDDAEAEDAVQEAYLLAYRAIGRFRGEAKLSTWLVRIVVNEAVTRLRKRNRGAEVILLESGAEQEHGYGGENMEQETPEQPEPSERPERAALRSETRRLLEAKIDDLPGAFRAVFVLRAVEELSVEETAGALGIPEATVRTRFFRAKGLLREALSKEIDLAYEDAFAFAGARCDRIVENMMARLTRGGAGSV
ncbi:MAG: RNA polymerase sigma factor [Betaproteobacteria bacterium]|nr:MAG: RNA polymerase sigma factor [Betaproteobacteria bacterium]